MSQKCSQLALVTCSSRAGRSGGGQPRGARQLVALVLTLAPALFQGGARQHRAQLERVAAAFFRQGSQRAEQAPRGRDGLRLHTSADYARRGDGGRCRAAGRAGVQLRQTKPGSSSGGAPLSGRVPSPAPGSTKATRAGMQACECEPKLALTRLPVQEWAISWATTLASERSPARSVGVTNVRHGFCTAGSRGTCTPG